MFQISYSQQNSSLNDVFLHLEQCSRSFKPILSTYVNIQSYSKKIYEKANLFEAWNKTELVGLIAAYFNKEQGFVFITNVSVFENFQNNLIGETLLNNVIDEAQKANLNTIRLEVYQENTKVISFYKKYGFYPKRLENGKWEMWLEITDSKPLVSISCITYNHEKFIAEALDSFLMQQLPFRIEILIHDDASTDNTQEIIKEYERKYPDIINPIYQIENQYSKSKIISANFNYPRARGKYIAVCEGDDVWSDPRKLLKQVEILEKDTTVNLCFSNATIIGEYERQGEIIQNIYPEVFDINYYLSNYGPMPTCTWVFRKSSIDFDNIPEFLSKSMIGDYVWRFLIVNQGKFAYLNESTALYRKHSGGIMSSEQRVNIIHNQKYTITNLRNHFNGKYNFYYNKNEHYAKLAVEYIKISKFANWFYYLTLATFTTLKLKNTFMLFKSSMKIIVLKITNNSNQD